MGSTRDWAAYQEYDRYAEKERAKQVIKAPEYTGLSSSYYTVKIDNPTTPENSPYTAECNDIIEALGLNFAEGNIFKAIWRIGASRTLNKHKKGHNNKYDIEKIYFFAKRLYELENSDGGQQS